MDQAVPVIPTFGTYLGYARPQGNENRIRPKYLDNPDHGNDPLETG
jgi:hypothetical protein